MQSSLLKRLFFRSSFVAKMSQNLKRAARVQENIQSSNYKIQHEAKLRQRVTVQSSVQALENEMREEIARSLKNSESKVIYLIKKAEQRWKEVGGVVLSAQQKHQYNQLISQCERARWEFMVHRQAVGFTIRNYQMVTTIYKIPPKVPVEGQ